MGGMRGISAINGQLLGGIDHLRQSIQDILTTPLGSRVMRRNYGSRLFELIDAPMNQAGLLEIYMATVEALMKWEPRISVQRVFAEAASPGHVTLSLQGAYIPYGSPILIDGILV